MSEPWVVITELAREAGVSAEAVKKWRQRGVPHKWRLPLLKRAAERGLDLPEETFDGPNGERSPPEQSPPTAGHNGRSDPARSGGAGAGGQRPRRATQARASLVIEDIDADTLAALRARARRAGHSLENEVRMILRQAARSDRGELASWAAALRVRLRKTYAGDATADIRADRER